MTDISRRKSARRTGRRQTWNPRLEQLEARMMLSITPSPVVMFDESLDENPEGITVDKVGNVFASLGLLGEVRKIAPGTNEAVPFGAIENFEGSGGELTGLVADAPGNVYGAACFSCLEAESEELAGVWRFDRKTGEAERLPGTEAVQGADGLTFDNVGNLYVSDVRGSIWKVPRGGSAELWVEDDVLAPNVSPGVVGINGIAYRQGAIYGVNTSKQSVIAVPVEVDGSAGQPQVLGTLPGFHFPDGVAFDVHGMLYIATVVQDAVVRVDPDDVAGSFEVVTGGGFWGAPQPDDPLDVPTSLAFGTGKGDRTTLFFVNYSISERFGAGVKSLPSVVSIDVGVPGQPIGSGGLGLISAFLPTASGNTNMFASREDAGISANSPDQVVNELFADDLVHQVSGSSDTEHLATPTAVDSQDLDQALLDWFDEVDGSGLLKSTL